MTNDARQGRSKTESKSSSDALSFATPALNLPKGGGAIRGLGEKFAANPVTGPAVPSSWIWTATVMPMC